MKNLFLCIFVLCALPNVLAISCYLCVPDITTTTCTSNVTNVTNCDTLQSGILKGYYDACMKTTRVIKFGGQDLTMNSMTCMVKSLCDNSTKEACDPIPGMTTKKCNSTCCFKDKCNGLEAATTPAPTATATTVSATTSGKVSTTPGSNACSHVASFIYIFMCATVIFAKVFLH